MNSNQIFTGEEYAWFKSKPKGSNPSGAAKVKVLSMRKTKDPYAKNASTQVEIEILEEGKGYTMAYFKKGDQKWVPARDIIDYWDAYEDEQKALEDDRIERERLRILEREAQERENRRKEVEVLVVTQLIGDRLTERGLPYDSIALAGSRWEELRKRTVTIRVQAVLDWLDISDVEISNAVYAVLSADSKDPRSDDSIVLPSSGN